MNLLVPSYLALRSSQDCDFSRNKNYSIDCMDCRGCRRGARWLGDCDVLTRAARRQWGRFRRLAPWRRRMLLVASPKLLGMAREEAGEAGSSKRRPASSFASGELWQRRGAGRRARFCSLRSGKVQGWARTIPVKSGSMRCSSGRNRIGRGHTGQRRSDEGFWSSTKPRITFRLRTASALA